MTTACTAHPDTSPRMLRLLPCLLAALIGMSATAVAQSPTPADTTSATATAIAETPAGEGPVAVPEPSARAVSYYRSGNVLWIVATLWGLLVPAALLFSGLSARMRNLAWRIGRNWFFTIVAYAAIFSVLTWLVDLPLSYYSGYVRQHAYGLSNQTLQKWFADALKGLGVGIVGLALTLWIPYLLLQKSPRRWWLYTALATIPLIVLVMLITPIWIQPLFNDFGPMRNRELEARILALADRAGIEGGRVYEVNKSVDTRAVNAYVTGFAETKRIVLWDTLLRKLNEDEVLFVMGHEMGHYVLRHTWWLVGIGTTLTLVSLYTVYRTAGSLIHRFHNRFGFDRLSDVASLPLLMLIVSGVSLAVTPVVNTVTRHFEHEADRFGLEITRANRPAATAFVKLQEQNLMVPYPGVIYRLWRSSHPVLGERVEFANRYRPWERGEPLKYQARFSR